MLDVVAPVVVAAVYEAQDRQADFHRCLEYIVLYGGAKGGGKSWALLAEAARQAGVPGRVQITQPALQGAHEVGIE